MILNDQVTPRPINKLGKDHFAGACMVKFSLVEMSAGQHHGLEESCFFADFVHLKQGLGFWIARDLSRSPFFQLNDFLKICGKICTIEEALQIDAPYDIDAPTASR